MTSDQFDKVTMGPDSPREKAKKLRNLRQKFFEKERLGMIIDGTGDDFEKIKKKRERLEELGYDTYMVFVNTDMDVALQRNADRERSLPDDLVTDIWKAVQNNLGKFARLFGQGQFSIVDNTEYAPLSKEVDKEVQRFVRQPIRNPIGKKWQEAAIEMKKR
jgi:predicted kinase